MAMNFWEAQRKARSRTSLFLFFFILMTLGIAILIEVAVRFLAQEGYTAPMPYLGFIFLGLTFLISGFYYLTYKSSGGSYVAESLGGRQIDAAHYADFKEKQLVNIVQEMALASGQPLPAIYVLDSKEINAFAAGMHPENAAITVTRGALELLNRDELQGVVAHEFGHIFNGDMRVSMRLAAMIMGFFIITYIGLRLLEGSLLGGRNGKKGGNAIALAALIFLAAGIITWFAGAILRSMVSRQREFLADACAVQFTRNPQGIGNALRKIAQYPVRDMPRHGMAYAHLYFDNHSFWSSLFATHPPIEKRIAAIEDRDYIPEEWEKNLSGKS
jgi:heat shock protein HtpX